MVPSIQPITPKVSRSATPPEQTSIIWELGNGPIALDFCKSNQDEQFNVITLPQILITDSDLNTTYLLSPFLLKLSQWRPHLNFPASSKPRKLLPAF
ncbi:hypothetical protein N7463_000152 [Penicillium fimorum]|uniref:Uncharacterized protein n=1 Tax=Penicillium fimorum TaxID=1882269 RepID=A0A9W9Y3Q0_9EURO|nr:hypothetical protein N7463_000152 [Penicillium fimorum]